MLVLAISALIYFPFLGSGRSLTAHEGFVSVPALRILETGHWIVPQYVAWVWVEKPPLVIWLTAISFQLLGGFSELAARMPAALSAAALCGLMAWFAQRCVNRHVGILAGLVQATCLYAYIQGRLGETDFPFVLLIAAAHVVLAVHWVGGESKLPLRGACLFHTFLGLAILAKGPLAIALVGATILLWCVMQRDWRPLTAVVVTPGAFCSIAIALSWHGLAVAQLGGFAIDRWVYNYVDRATGEHRLGARSLFYYIWTIPYVMLPWSVLLIASWRQLRQDWNGPHAKLVRFCWAWFLAGLLLLTIAAGKSTHYCFPILPPLSILAAMRLQGLQARLGARYNAVVGSVLVVAVLCYATASGWLIPYLDHWRATADFVRETTKRPPPQARLILVGLGHSMVYPYVARQYEYLDSMNDVAMLIESRPTEEIWILALRQDAEQESRVQLESVELEVGRTRHANQQLLICGAVRR